MRTLITIALATVACLSLSGQAQAASKWARPYSVGPVRTAPNNHAHKITRTHMVTEDGYCEIYKVLKVKDGWVKIVLPGRPNGTTGWIRRTHMSDINTTHKRLVVDKSAHTITLYNHGKRVFRSRVGHGAPGTPTPSGHFWIREKFHAGGSYGPRAFGTADYSVLTDWPGGGVIGIHGTDEPGLIPGRPSHGCIRMWNSAILKLYKMVGVGTPLDIRW